jgi:hypothetical protein
MMTKYDAASDELIGISLKWKRAGSGWRLFDGKRRFGRVVPDAERPGMWRSVMSGGRLSDMANLSWARHSVMDVARRELEYEHRQGAVTDPSKCPQNEGVFAGISLPMRLQEGEGIALAPAPEIASQQSSSYMTELSSA